VRLAAAGCAGLSFCSSSCRVCWVELLQQQLLGRLAGAASVPML
jgi:hypothetical protein